MHRVLQLFFKLVRPFCVHCASRAALWPDYVFCAECQPLLQQVSREDICGYCGVPLVSEWYDCLDCRQDPPPYGSLFCCWWYDGAGLSLLRSYKFKGDWGLGAYLADRLQRYLDQLPGSDLAVLSPVPSNPRAWWRRSYDPVVRILKAVRGYRWQRLLGRQGGKSQKTLGRQERLQNLMGKLYIRRADRPVPPWVILIDDVYTSGATMRVASQTLLNAGVGRVDCFCFFRD
jgi:predicted amidophosphoribosyltransferase